MPSFDIVSRTEVQEVDNAVNGVKREVTQRYDFKGSKAEIELKDEEIILTAEDDYKIKTMQELLKASVTRRGLDVKAFDFKDVEKAGGQMLKQKVLVKQGIESDIAKKITKAIKEEKLKVQASIRGDEVRVEGKKRDDLQGAITFIKTLDLEVPVQFINFRD